MTKKQTWGEALVHFFSAIGAIIFSGFTFSILWGWFVVPLFGLPALGIATALGVLLVATYATKNVPTKAEREEYSLGRLWGRPAGALVVGGIIKLFM